MNYSGLSMFAYVLLTRIARGVLGDALCVLAVNRRFADPCIWRYRWISEYIAELEVSVTLCYGWCSFHRRYSSGYITPSPSLYSLLGDSFALSAILLLGIQTSANAFHSLVFRMLIWHHFSTIHNVFVFDRPLRFSMLYLPIVPHVLSSLEWILAILSCSQIVSLSDCLRLTGLISQLSIFSLFTYSSNPANCGVSICLIRNTIQVVTKPVHYFKVLITLY